MTETPPAPKPSLSIAKVIAFLEPVIPIVSGAVAAWLLVHLHFLGIFHVDQSQIATAIASVVVFAVTAGLTYASHHFHWLPITITKAVYGKTSVIPGLTMPELTATQILSFVTPYIAVAAGALVSWAFVHLHVLGFLHLQETSVTKTVAGAAVFLVTALITWLAHTFNFLPLVHTHVRLGHLSPDHRADRKG